MEKELLLRVEALERTVRTLDAKVSQLEMSLANMHNNTQVNGPYNGNAFRSPFGNPFQYQPVVPIMNPPAPGQSSVQNNNSVEQKLDRLLELMNNNFSRLNFRLEALENERRE